MLLMLLLGDRIACESLRMREGLAGCRKAVGSSSVPVSVHVSIERDKGIRWMPWHREAMKDVARCEKRRGAASRL